MAARGLGKGLDSMIPKSLPEVKAAPETKKEEKTESNGKNISIVKISKVEPNREQPRKTFDEDALEELSDSIKQYGLLEPILVQDRGDYYMIIAGERRWRASRMAGLKEVPVIVGNYTEQEIVEISLIENVQREDINPIEEALAYKKLMTEFNMKQETIAEKVSKSRSVIANAMRLLKLDEKVQQMIMQKLISTGHARALLGVEDSTMQFELAQRILDENLSVREIEKIVKNLGKPTKEKPVLSEDFTVFYKDMSEKLKNSLGTKVSISGKGDGSGKIEIEFFSNADLDRLYDKLR